jgi:hypothetical protein
MRAVNGWLACHKGFVSPSPAVVYNPHSAIVLHVLRQAEDA